MAIIQYTTEQLRRIICSLRKKLKAAQANASGGYAPPGAYSSDISDLDARYNEVPGDGATNPFVFLKADPNRQALHIWYNGTGAPGLSPILAFTPTFGLCLFNLKSPISFWRYRDGPLVTCAWCATGGPWGAGTIFNYVEVFKLR